MPLDLPEPSLLRLVSSEGQTAVSFGDKVLFCFACDDVGMRNMAVVSLTDAGVQGKQVAAAFGLSAEYVSILRGRARIGRVGGAGAPPWPPTQAHAGQVAKARGWAAEGVTQTEIARRLSVSRPVIGELLARLGPAPQQPALPDAPVDAGTAGPGGRRRRRTPGRRTPGRRTRKGRPVSAARCQERRAGSGCAGGAGGGRCYGRPGSGRAASPAGMPG